MDELRVRYHRLKMYFAPTTYKILLILIRMLLTHPLALKEGLTTGRLVLPADFYVKYAQNCLRYSVEQLSFCSGVNNLDLEHLQELVRKAGIGERGSLISNSKCILYAIARVLKPKIVVETGVFKGFSSMQTLQALADNGEGMLYSIDSPHPILQSVGLEVGFVVPEVLRERWNLNLGKSSEILSSLLKELKEVDLFFHDSDHSYENMMFEFSCAWPYIREEGFLVSDDVNDNEAFTDFCRDKGVEYIILGSMGICRKE